MNNTTIDARTRELVEERQKEFAAMLEAHPEAQAIAMAYVAGMEAAMAKMADRK